MNTSCLAVALAATLLLAGGCGDDGACGPDGAPKTGLLASSADVILNFGNVTSGANNDCPEMDAPPGVVSLTLQGSEIGGDGPGLLTLCIRRPDLLAERPLQLGPEVLIIDLGGSVGGCTYAYEALRPVTGTASAEGFCANGTDPAGYSFTVNGSISLRRMCPTLSDTIAVSFAGTIAIEAMRP